MNKVGKINTKKIIYEDDFLSSRFEFNINGEDIDHVVVNTIRRACLSDIPIYIYNKFVFVENTSVFNNNYIKLRLRNIPVLGIKSNSPFFEKVNNNKEENNMDSNLLNMDDITLDTNYDISLSNLEQLTLYLDKENKSNSIITVGTDDCKFYYKEKEIPSPYKINIPIIKLQGGQTIKLTAISELGIEKMDAIYSPASVLYFNRVKDDNYNFIVESRGQLDEITILKYGISNILKQLDDLKSNLENLDNDKKKGSIEIENCDHTLGNILSEGMRRHKNVEYGGYSMPHLLDEKIIINFNIKSGNIKDILFEVVNYYNQVFNKISENLNFK